MSILENMKQGGYNAYFAPCMCDDCGKHMEWEGVDWCITNYSYLLCGFICRFCNSDSECDNGSMSIEIKTRACA